MGSGKTLRLERHRGAKRSTRSERRGVCPLGWAGTGKIKALGTRNAVRTRAFTASPPSLAVSPFLRGEDDGKERGQGRGRGGEDAARVMRFDSKPRLLFDKLRLRNLSACGKPASRELKRFRWPDPSPTFHYEVSRGNQSQDLKCQALH
jgi:hypothetical protein